MAKLPKKPVTKRNEELTIEERELFLSAFFQGGIYTEPQDRVDAEELAIESASSVDQAIDEEERDLFLRAVEEGVKGKVAHQKQLEPYQRASPSLPKCKPKDLVDAKLDLHGYSAEDATLATNRFIEQERSRGSKVLLIVHGIGTGKVKNAVWNAIEAHHLVDDFQLASGKLGGQGAVIVRINRKRKRV